MCSGGQLWWKGVGGDDGGKLGADLRALGEEVGEK